MTLLPTQVLAVACKAARRSSSTWLPPASQCCWFIFFSSHGPKYPTFSVVLLMVLQPQATDIYQSKHQVRYLQDGAAAVLRGKDGDVSATKVSPGAGNSHCQ